MGALSAAPGLWVDLQGTGSALPEQFGPKRGGFVLDREGKPVDHRTATVEQFMASDTVFAGTPDDVYNQIRDFNERIGGFGHLLFFGQGGFLDHKDTEANITLFA